MRECAAGDFSSAYVLPVLYERLYAGVAHSQTDTCSVHPAAFTLAERLVQSGPCYHCGPREPRQPSGHREASY
jgi:hypothetical protein